MFQSILADIKSTFRYGNMLNKLIIINVGVYLFVNILYLLLFFTNGGVVPPFYQKFIHFFAISSDWKEILLHPWSIVTHMFLHEGFWHILFNMLILFWFGKIIGDLLGDRRVLPVYFYGGLAGAATYFISYNVFGFLSNGTGYAIGASAGVMAIVVGAATTSPNYVMRLLLLGDVKIKYIAIVLILLDLFGTASMSNSGGHFAHLGGAAFGAIFVTMLRNGNDLSIGFNQVFDKINAFFSQWRERGTRNPNMNVIHRKRKKDEKVEGERRSDGYQERLDQILDKINEHGYEQLTDEEKEFLYQASKK